MGCAWEQTWSVSWSSPTRKWSDHSRKLSAERHARFWGTLARNSTPPSPASLCVNVVLRSRQAPPSQMESVYMYPAHEWTSDVKRKDVFVLCCSCTIFNFKLLNDF